MDEGRIAIKFVVQMSAVGVVRHGKLVGKCGKEFIWIVSVIGAGKEEACTKSVL